MGTVEAMTDDRSQLERMLAGDLYLADDPELQEKAARARRLARDFAECPVDRPDEARAVLAEVLGELGEEIEVRAPLYVDYGFNIAIGPRTFVNYGLTALDVAPIRIGADCQIGPHVQLLTPTHPVEAGPRRDKLEAAAPVTIGDNVWLGGGVIVRPGVTIGDDSVVGAGSVVTRDIPAGVVAVGNPARVTRQVG